jgi:hypothetical protein
MKNEAEKAKKYNGRAMTILGFFMLATVYCGTWLVFYGTAWVWGVLGNPGTQKQSHESVIHMHRIWVDFQAKIDAPHALANLTTCLRDALPDRNATIADFTSCLKKMGMDDAFVGSK